VVLDPFGGYAAVEGLGLLSPGGVLVTLGRSYEPSEG
jgi:hypothetical protein